MDIIRKRVRVDAAALSDESINLKDVLAGSIVAAR
jgi:hypothetical protein